ncbi:U3 snoRNP protein [Knufia peltigerae]|uniref:U3 snoRNP protein n=1 Tax=Knufia peltigerae TaxID=1002370 RepID=A0AA38XMD4_9EURO|nr:U3 snoRNP protein [Knufia peltigerae]
MAPISPGQGARQSRKPKKTTDLTNLHRYEPFTRRISRLKIDPVHKVERRKPTNDETDLTQSYFRSALEEWAELNLSQTFTSFLNKTSPLCENLPQLLHHADAVFELLLQHVEKKDALALEPLLSLAAHLAHDLGQRFEHYFSRMVTLVAQVAASHDSADVIEWCFTCLAWMFKYLSRLLVQDLRPLLDIMIPYLSSKKEYIVRFSAESLAFLLRKAAVMYPKKKSPLTLALQHLFARSNVGPVASVSYQVGVMSLCAESAKGIDGALHSSADSLLQCLLAVSRPMCEQQETRSIVEGVLVALIHDTDSAGFYPVVGVTLDMVRQCTISSESAQILFGLRLLTVILGTRKGSRISSSWKDAIQAYSGIAQAAMKFLDESNISEEEPDLRLQVAQTILAVSAEILTFAPMDQLLPQSQKILALLEHRLVPAQFFTFCTVCAELGTDRFPDLVLPRLQQYLIDHWSADQMSTHYLLQHLNHGGMTLNRKPGSLAIDCPRGLVDALIGSLSADKTEGSDTGAQQLVGQIYSLSNTRPPREPRQVEALVDGFEKAVVHALQEHSGLLDLRRRVVLGSGLNSYLDLVPNDNIRRTDLLSLVQTTSPDLFRFSAFVAATRRLFESVHMGNNLPETRFDSIRYVLLENLLSPSKKLKVGSLSLLSHMKTSGSDEWLSETVDLMQDILRTPYLPSEARKIAMFLRRLPQRQKKIASNSSLENLIPYFCLGLVASYHDQTRQEVCNVLAQIVEVSPVEEAVVNITIQWLQAPTHLSLVQRHVQPQPKTTYSAFESADLSTLEGLCQKTLQDFSSSKDRFFELVEAEHSIGHTSSPENGRTLALQILSSIPASAERRSRLLVPVFLSAPMTREQAQQKSGSDTSTSSNTLGPEVDDNEWSLSDRKALLTLFSKFMNPKVLFRSSEVYEKLLELLGNGNLDVRKLALQAVLTWKQPSLTRYETLLYQIAEDKSTTTELGTMLDASEGEGAIRSEDRAVVLPVFLRLIFGIIVGRAGTVGSQEARRKAIIRVLFRMQESEVTRFLDVALGKLRDVKILPDRPDSLYEDILLPEDQQYGFLRLLLSMLETLQTRFAPYGRQVVDAVVFCVIRASTLAKATTSSSALSRNIRRVGFQSLILLSRDCPDIPWSQYLPTLFAHAITPRLEIFASETSQGISGLLRLFAVWSQVPNMISFLRQYDNTVPSVLWKALSSSATQNEVKVFILENIVLPWANILEDKSTLSDQASEILEVEADGLLTALVSLLENTPPKEILVAITSVLPKIARFARSPESKQATLSLLAALLRDSARRLPPNVKSQLLKSIQSFLETVDAFQDEQFGSSVLDLVSSLFNYFKDEANRQILCQVMDRLSTLDSDLVLSAQLCRDMNAVATDRLEDIDFDKRLEAFQAVNQLEPEKNSAKCWLPIIHNLLFFVRTVDEFSIRSNALSCLKQLIIKACGSQRTEMTKLATHVVLPSVKKGVRSESELVRADCVSLYGLMVQYAQGDPDLENLRPLLVGNDEEASFFSNILHIQQHRRLRAIRRLLSEVEKGAISPRNVAEVFIPLLEMFVYDSGSDESAQSTKGQSIAAMGTLLQWIDWKHFKVLLHKYKNDITAGESNEKVASRLLSHAAEALSAARSHQSDDQTDPTPYLSTSLPSSQTIENELRKHFIPKFAELVHCKDEAEISFRIPVAVTTIKLIMMLPEEEIQLLAAPIILDIAHILRSRTQESRDTARNTLCQTVMLLGPSSLQFVLKELRNALTRGYQLHVLSFTLHAILVTLTPNIQLGDLDYCVQDLVAVIMDDTFGTVGQEKDNQDYVSSMKEVKSNKSYDSMELLSKSISVQSLSNLVSPIQTLLLGSLTTKQVRQVDELLRRVGAGVSQNPGASKRDLLVFAYQLIQAIYKEKETVKVRQPTVEEQSRQRYLIKMTSAHKTVNSQTSPLLYKMARFALDLVRSVLQKHDEVLTVENVHGFLPVIGDALIEAQEDVKISAMRLLSAIIKLPMPELDQNGPLYVMEAVKVVKNSTDTNEEAAQAALKLVATVLRERKQVKVRDIDIAELLHRITPDIEEPDRQGVTFNFIRAVMARKVQIPEIYEVVDKIGIMMVTNQGKGARDTARGVYVHFLIEYPQSSSRWSKQQKFMMKNLEYEYPEGRQSVLEAINTLIAKTKGEAAQDLNSTFFVPVLLRMANDENKGCRDLAGALLGQMFRSADNAHLREFLGPLRAWIEQNENMALQKVSMQAYNILLGSGVGLDDGEITGLRDNLAGLLQQSATDNDGDEWESLFQALLLWSKLVESRPDVVLNQKQTKLWVPVWKSLSHPHAWVQSTSAGLVCDFFRHCLEADHSKLPLTCDHGLRLDRETFLEVLKASVRILRRTEGNEDLSSQAVQILLFLGQCMNVNGLTMEVADKSVDDEDEAMQDGVESEDERPTRTKKIPGFQYLLDQVTRILRIEATSLTSAAFLPKKLSLVLLSTLIPALSSANLSSQAHNILVPLQHLTDPNTIQPRSADPSFSSTYQQLIELSHEVMDKVQNKLGDGEYVKTLTEVSRTMRKRREERRTKRRIERVAEPERAAQYKKRKSDRKKERKKEIGRAHQSRRRETGT